MLVSNDQFEEIVSAVSQAVGEMTAFPEWPGNNKQSLDDFLGQTYIREDWEDLRKRAAEVAVRKALELL